MSVKASNGSEVMEHPLKNSSARVLGQESRITNRLQGWRHTGTGRRARAMVMRSNWRTANPILRTDSYASRQKDREFHVQQARAMHGSTRTSYRPSQDVLRGRSRRTKPRTPAPPERITLGTYPHRNHRLCGLMVLKPYSGIASLDY